MSSEKTLPTYCAPAERASESELRQQVAGLAGCPLARVLFDALHSIVMILNPERQVLWGNKTLQELLKIESSEEIVGQRPGELLACIHAGDEPGGCGTSSHCTTCGTVTAIMASQAGLQEVRECRLCRNSENGIENFDLQVCAAPIELDGQKFTVFSILDISGEKRRHALERIFLHDIANTVSSVQGFAQILHMQAAPKDQPMTNRLLAACNRLLSELAAQKQLLAAESGELIVKPAPIGALEFLQEIQREYEFLEIASQRAIRIATESEDVVFTSDPTLISRVLGNMIKNALEAALPGEHIMIGCRPVGEEIEFWVHNAAYMPPEVQLQIFQRSFSTKGSNRGLGTYSMCLLSTRYLNGKVFFASTQEQGTTFRVRYPRVLTARSAPAPAAAVNTTGKPGGQNH